jgi:hypothetical protein
MHARQAPLPPQVARQSWHLRHQSNQQKSRQPDYNRRSQRQQPHLIPQPPMVRHTRATGGTRSVSRSHSNPAVRMTTRAAVHTFQPHLKLPPPPPPPPPHFCPQHNTASSAEASSWSSASRPTSTRHSSPAVRKATRAAVHTMQRHLTLASTTTTPALLSPAFSHLLRPAAGPVAPDQQAHVSADLLWKTPKGSSAHIPDTPHPCHHHPCSAVSDTVSPLRPVRQATRAAVYTIPTHVTTTATTTAPAVFLSC